MSAYSIDTALAQLKAQIDSFEKAVFKVIEEKKMSEKSSVSINKINRKLQNNPIAIVGMASLFAQARNLQQYWQNIINKIDCITDVPSSHWNIEDYYDPNPRTPEDKTYCKRGGFIPYVDFNPMEFGIPPSILEVTDVSQLLSLVIAKEAMEDAGYGTSRDFNRDTVGVILGVAMAKQLGMPLAARLEYPVWEKVLKSSGLSDEDTQKIVNKIKSAYVNWDENAFPGMLANVVAGRIANRLNLGGINCVIDAACASSFAALKMAISELVEHRCDMMLTGGVDTDNTIMAYISFSKTPAVTPSETVKPFDAKSDGMMLGEGIGMIVLKRLEDAVRDNDKIYAVIKGIGTSSDGRYKSIYAPRQEGQVAALKRAYDDAGFPAETVTMVEAHGTGTMAGDPTEFAAIKEFFAEKGTKKQQIALGSVKSQIGHTKAAAGAASLIKTALALHHKILPPTINVTQPNPKLNIKNSPFYLNTETRPWIRAEGEAPRRAGVSSFGFGGTNYHVVLEEYEAEHQSAYRIHKTSSEVLLYAQNHAQLLSKCEDIQGLLQSDAGEKHYLELLEESKSTDIPQNAARVGFVVDSRVEACKLLQICIDLLKNKAQDLHWEHPQGIYYRQSGLSLSGKVVALFSGQGSQYLDMGRELVMNFPQMRHMYGYMDSLLLKDNLQPLSQIVFPQPVFEEAEKNTQVAVLQRTEYAQPAIGMLSAGLYKILQQAGFKADFLAGHSFGELTALWAAGVLSEEDYCFLVKARGQAMAAPQDPDYDAGAMLAVKEEVGKVEAVLKQFPSVAIANLNSPRQVVLAGPVAQIEKARQHLQDQGYTAVVLPVSAAFHTPLIAFAHKAFAQAIKTVNFHNPQIPVYTNVTGKQYPQDSAAIQNILETHLNNPVLFKQEIENIYASGGYCFVEIGPRKILSNLVKDILGERPHITVALNPSAQKNSDRSLREGVVQLRVAGLSLKNLDPYQLPQQLPTTEKKALSVSLNGINYVSEKTKLAWVQALQDGHQVKLTAPQSPENVNTQDRGVEELLSRGVEEQEQEQGSTRELEDTLSSSPQHSISTALDLHSTPSPQHSISTALDLHSIPSPQHSSTPTPAPQLAPVKMPATPDKLVNYQRLLESLEYVLTQFQQNQSENLQVHGHYLNHQQEYAKTFFQLMQQQNSLFANTPSSTEAEEFKPVAMESLERSMMQFHSQQSETLRIHEQYLQHQLEYTKNFFQLIQQEYSQLVTGSAVTLPVSSDRLQITSEITTQHNSPVLAPVVDEFSVTEYTVDPSQRDVSTPNPITPSIVETSQPDVAGVPIVQPSQRDDSTTSSGASINLTDLGKNLLAITSEKTGYPVEMLDLDMDMEADLGIDSIKRVEIMGAMQDMYPDLPKPNVEELGDIRTIGQIVEYLQSLASGSVGVEVAVCEATESVIGLEVNRLRVREASRSEASRREDAKYAKEEEEKEEVKILVEEEVFVSPVLSVSSALVEESVVVGVDEPVGVDLPDFSQSLLAITSEKTGYPVEMLELDMDMEADLGIDSIKRVEILGALQEMYPDLPKPNVEELGELRTIGQIVEYLEKLVGGEKKKSQPPSCNPPASLNSNPLRRQIKLRTLPQPDFLDFALPEGHVILLTDDGSLTTSKLAQSLVAQNWKVVIFNYPLSVVPQRAPLPAEVYRVELASLSEEHLQEQLQSVIVNYGPIGAFIHLNPVFELSRNGRIPYLEEEKAIVKHVFFMAKHLKKSLNEAARSGRSCFCTVVRLDGAFGLEHTVNFGPISAGLFGLTKTLNWEWEQVFCRAIDLSPVIDAQESAHHIIAELHDPNRYITEVAYGSQGRVTLISTPC